VSAAALGPGSTGFEIRTVDGLRLRAAALPAQGRARAHVALLHGRTEFLEKYAPVAAAFAERGFDVVSADWRGQGGSERLLPDPRRGHVDDFTAYQRDLDALLAAPQAAAAAPRIMVAHSMGGAVGLRALAEGRGGFVAAVFSAPMWGIKLPFWAAPVARLIAGAASRFGRAGAYAPGAGGATPYASLGFGGNALTSDAEQFAWIAARVAEAGDAALGAPTLGWLGAALAETDALRRMQIETPALALVGGDEAVVSPRAIADIARRNAMTLATIPGGRHEMFFETPTIRAEMWRRIDAFLADRGI
jgi:lysophospholipase